MNRVETAFLKNYDLKTKKKSAYSNHKQLSTFLKTQYFKRLTCNFKSQTAILSNINCVFKYHFFKSHILKSQTQIDL
jgi:hypothetical protein